jgi:hypothetical protein
MVWLDLPSVTSIGPIFKRLRIETFVVTRGRHDCCLHKSIKTRRSVRKSEKDY